MKQKLQFTNEGLDKMKKLSGIISENESTESFEGIDVMSDASEMGLFSHMKTLHNEKLFVGGGDSTQYVIIKSIEYNVPFPHEGKPEEMLGKSDAWWNVLANYIKYHPQDMVQHIQGDNDAKLISSNEKGVVYYIGGDLSVDHDF